MGKKYKTGKPCLRHPELQGTRYSNGGCPGCARAYYLANVEARREYQRGYAVEYYRLNAERVKEYQREYRHTPGGRAQKKATSARLRARKVAPSLVECWAAVMKRLQVHVAAGHEMDHIVPFGGRTVTGLHVPWNTRPIGRDANRLKNNRFDPDDPEQGDVAFPDGNNPWLELL